MILPQNDNDDPLFVQLVDTFVRAYITSHSAKRVVLIHVDNWFGERWLGFAGKLKGIAGIRQRRGELGIDVRKRSLAIPPFRPSRIQAYAGFTFNDDGSTSEFTTSPLHQEKNGGWTRTLFSDGLCAWYSGNTKNNTSGCLMIYESNQGGQNAWYLQFQKDAEGKWDVNSCRNTQISECRAISASHYDSVG